MLNDRARIRWKYETIHSFLAVHFLNCYCTEHQYFPIRKCNEKMYRKRVWKINEYIAGLLLVRKFISLTLLYNRLKFSTFFISIIAVMLLDLDALEKLDILELLIFV